MTIERKRQLRRQYLSDNLCQQLAWRDLLATMTEQEPTPRTTYTPRPATIRTSTPSTPSTPKPPPVSPTPAFANEWERKAIAHHEAGHAFAYMLFGAKNIEANIIPAPGLLGSAKGEDIEDRETRAVVILCGMYADVRFRTPTGRPAEIGFRDPLPGHGEDQAKLFALIGRPDNTNTNLHGRLRAAAQLLVSRHWSEIQTTAAALLARGTVEDADLRKMFPYTRPYRKWW